MTLILNGNLIRKPNVVHNSITQYLRNVTRFIKVLSIDLIINNQSHNSHKFLIQNN